MERAGIPLWLNWAREIEAIGQTGLQFSTEILDRTRYRRLVGIASEILAQYSNVPEERYEQTFLSQEGYTTPKVDVRAAVFKEDKILMVQERLDGAWSIPGGYADVNEKPSAMAEREVMEESGFIGLDQLPQLLTTRVTRRIIEEAFAHSHDPLRLAAFD